MRDRVFTDGPGPFTDRLRSAGVDLIIDAHFVLLGSSLDDLLKAGFCPKQVTTEALQRSFTECLGNLANEAAGWITQGDEEHDVIAECAADVICALAALYELLPRGSAFTTTEEFSAATARLAMASQFVGNQETMLTFARMGYIDDFAKAKTNLEAAQEAGRQGARLRASDAEKWRRQARSDWAAYCGPLSKSAWATRNAPKYNRAWRSVFDALPDAGDK